jgi:hypothetical protein
MEIITLHTQYEQSEESEGGPQKRRPGRDTETG